MANSQNFLDNLRNLRLVVSVALEHTRDNLQEFAKEATTGEVRQGERLISQIRSLAEELEREFVTLENLLSKVRLN